MHRYWIFPLMLAITGSILPIVCLLEGIAPWAVYFASSLLTSRISRQEVWQVIAEVWNQRALTGALAGAIFGVAVVAWHRAKHLQTAPEGAGVLSRLIWNLMWCGFYALAFSAANDLLLCIIFKSSLFRTPQLSHYLRFVGPVPFMWTVLLNGVAVWWATIRSVNTTDVLTPRNLIGKLRHSAWLQAS